MGRHDFKRVAFGIGLFVASGHTDKNLLQPLPFVSSDGVNWVIHDAGANKPDIHRHRLWRRHLHRGDGIRVVGRSANCLSQMWHFTNYTASHK